MDKPNGIEAFDDVKRLIVVTAHPDDLECLCSGVITILVDRGVEVHSVTCTLGDLGTQTADIVPPALAATRLAENEAAAQLMGLASTHNLGLHDGELEPTLEVRARLARLYRTTQADTLFTFDPNWSGQIHPDHRAAGRAAIDAYLPSKMPLYRPEQLLQADSGLGCIERVFLFATDENADVVVDISAVQERKIAACVAHRSQFPDGAASLEWLREMDARFGERIGVPAAEAYRTIGVW